MTQRKMKDSGCEWLGDIPALWGIARIGGLYTVRNEKCSDKDFAPLSVTMKGVVPQLADVAKTDDGDNRKLVRKGDFVINSRSDRRGSCGISPLDGSVSVINTVLKPRGEMDPGYYNWAFHSSEFADEFYAWGHGIVDDLWTTRWSDMKSILVARPPLPEQRKIAAFLDGECGKIDVLRGKVEKQIAALEEYRKSVITEAVTKGVRRSRKMKASDVAWIATAPQEWERTRLKLLCDRDITYGIVKLGDPDEDGVKVLRCSDVLPGRIAEGEIRTVTKSLSQEYSRTILRGGEVVVNVRGTLGGCAVVPEKMRGYNIAREVAMVAVKGNAADARFIMYQLLSSSFDSYIKMQLSGAVYVGLNIEMLGKYSFFCPDLSEQHEIAAYLDKKCAAIDSMVAKCREELDRLAEYKKSLIYEYVTGKKEVA